MFFQPFVLKRLTNNHPNWKAKILRFFCPLAILSDFLKRSRLKASKYYVAGSNRLCSNTFHLSLNIQDGPNSSEVMLWTCLHNQALGTFAALMGIGLYLVFS